MFFFNKQQKTKCQKCGSTRCEKLQSTIGTQIKGVSVVYYNDYNGKQKTVLSVQENSNHKSYPNQYNVIGGKTDNGCIVDTAVRETNEETGIHLTRTEFLSLITDKNGKLRYYITGKGKNTLIFVADVTRLGWSRGSINQLITQNHKNPNLGHAYKETVCVEWININSKKTVDNKMVQISSYLDSVINIVDFTKI